MIKATLFGTDIPDPRMPPDYAPPDIEQADSKVSYRGWRVTVLMIGSWVALIAGASCLVLLFR